MPNSETISKTQEGKTVINIASSKSNYDWIRSLRRVQRGEEISEEKTHTINKRLAIDKIS